MTVLRPADGLETALCWAVALRKQDGPVCLILTRQNVPSLKRPTDFETASVAKGAYVIGKESNGPAELAIIATGSEVNNSMKAKEILETTNKNVSEAAFETGFKNLSHFSTSFREEFGFSPGKLL